MSDPWLDPTFQQLRQTVMATSGADYSNATTSYTAILTQSITIGRFTTAGVTTKLFARVVLNFTVAAGAGEVAFALRINGTDYEIRQDVNANGAYRSATIETQAALAAGTYAISVLGKVSTANTLRILAASAPTLARCTMYLQETTV